MGGETGPYPHEVHVFDAETGQFQWSWYSHKWTRTMAAGDEEGLMTRLQKQIRGACWPVSWATPAIGPDGTIYVGAENGVFYAVRDANGDGQIDSKTEVSSFDTGSNFPHSAIAHAPGMHIVTNRAGVFA